MCPSLQASKLAELVDHSDFSYDTTRTLPECNNNDLTFSVKDSSHGKRSDAKSHTKVQLCLCKAM